VTNSPNPPNPSPAVPTPTNQLDRELRAAVARWMRLRWILTWLVAFLLVAATVVGGYLISQQQGELTASCSLYHDLGQLSVEPTPPLKHVGEVTVVIVLDARRAFTGQCTGHLNPATGSLTHWAHYYHLQIVAPNGR
jgi:hypothetical protein